MYTYLFCKCIFLQEGVTLVYWNSIELMFSFYTVLEEKKLRAIMKPIVEPTGIEKFLFSTSIKYD